MVDAVTFYVDEIDNLIGEYTGKSDQPKTVQSNIKQKVAELVKEKEQKIKYAKELD